MAEINRITGWRPRISSAARARKLFWAAAFVAAGCEQTVLNGHEALAGSGPLEVESPDAVDLVEITDIESLPIAHNDLVDLEAVGHDLVVEEGEPDSRTPSSLGVSSTTARSRRLRHSSIKP